jgi:site-specific recombinase XerD
MKRSGVVWPTTTGGPANDKHDRDEWRAIQGTAGVGHPNGRYYDLHEARHTTATQLLAAGVDPRQITPLMGHSSILTPPRLPAPGPAAGARSDWKPSPVAWSWTR